MLYTAYVIGTQHLAWYSVLGLALSVGVVNGAAINTRHEFGDKTTTPERWLVKTVLAVVGYGHFAIEHTKGHHKDVATPENPASSRMGENIDAFACREIPGAMRRAWASGKMRLARRDRGPWTLDKEVLQALLITIPLYAALIIALGWVMLPFLIMQAFWGWFGMLSSANYIEHYGLLRQKLASGRYEPCQPRHSWNSNHGMSNLILFNLQRYSDHHANPTRRYPSLRAFENLPEIPSGYPLMFVIVLLPPLWLALMDPKGMAWAGGDLSLLNVLNSKRARLAARYEQGTLQAG